MNRSRRSPSLPAGPTASGGEPILEIDYQYDPPRIRSVEDLITFHPSMECGDTWLWPGDPLPIDLTHDLDPVWEKVGVSFYSRYEDPEDPFKRGHSYFTRL